MQSPAAEWGVMLGSVALLDYLRHRGEADQDTISEVTRDFIARCPRGRVVFLAGWGAFSLWFASHILSGLDDRIIVYKVAPATRQRPGA